MWYIGCLFGELLLNRPVFDNQRLTPLDRILELVGFPSPDDIEEMDSPFGKPSLDYFKSYEGIMSPSFKKVFPYVSDDCIDLLSKLLQLNPRKRIDTLSAIKHPYLKEFYSEEDIKVFDGTINLSDLFSEDISISEYRSKIRKNIVKKIAKEKRRRRRKESTTIN